MRLLVSVADAADAAAAVAGGADLIDAKDPHAGALGAVTADALRQIYTAVHGLRPVTAALDDATDEGEIEDAACRFSAAGVALVKVGFKGIASTGRVAALAAAAVRGAKAGSHGRSGVVAVAYADADSSDSIGHAALIEIARRAGAMGVLIDTADKHGHGLRGLMTLEALAAWVADAHDVGLIAAVAGKLTADDMPFACDAGADVAGVRGAACDGGRFGRVSATRVRLLHALCGGDRSQEPLPLRADRSLSI